MFENGTRHSSLVTDLLSPSRRNTRDKLDQKWNDGCTQIELTVEMFQEICLFLGATLSYRLAFSQAFKLSEYQQDTGYPLLRYHITNNSAVEIELWRDEQRQPLCYHRIIKSRYSDDHTTLQMA